MATQEINIGNLVEYVTPFEGEQGITYKVIEIEHSSNWIKVQAQIWDSFNPTYVGNITDFKLSK